MLEWIVELFFFFKQKTAYEMRISDWSSDVCSSRSHDVVEVEAEDLAALGIGGAVGAGDTGDQAAPLRDRQVERLMAHDRRDGGGEILRRGGHLEGIGRAACRERVCQYG